MHHDSVTFPESVLNKIKNVVVDILNMLQIINFIRCGKKLRWDPDRTHQSKKQRKSCLYRMPPNAQNNFVNIEKKPFAQYVILPPTKKWFKNGRIWGNGAQSTPNSFRTPWYCSTHLLKTTFHLFFNSRRIFKYHIFLNLWDKSLECKICP
jgi:hypothetical protein